MPTALELITQSLRTLGIRAAGEPYSDAEVQDALVLANQMLDSWSNDGLLVPALVHESFTLTGSGSYTIGTGGDINTARPISLESVRIFQSGGIEDPVTIATLDIWAGIRVKSAVYVVPRFVYYEPAYPLGTIYFSEIPETGNTLKLTTRKEITALPALNTAVDYQPGFERAIRLGLALELAPEYPEHLASVIPIIAAQYEDAMKGIRRSNSANRVRTSKVDSALLSRSPYNVNVGPL